MNQPRRRIVTSSVRQDDDHTITLEATQDMLFMSPEGLPSEGDIAQMTQVGLMCRARVFKSMLGGGGTRWWKGMCVLSSVASY